MNVGLLDIPGARSTRYWESFLNELGVQVASPRLDAGAAYALGLRSLPDAPAQVALVLGRLLELGNLDLVLLPRTRPVALDAWTSDLPELLGRRLSGLPRLMALPDGGDELRSAANDLGQMLTRSPNLVRTALNKVSPLATAPRVPAPVMSIGSRPTVAVIGPDSLLADAFLSAPLRERLEALGLHPVYANALPRDQLEERGERFTTASGKPLESGERDLSGALSLLEGKGAVRGVVYAAAARDAATLAALGRLAARAHKPGVSVEVDPQAPGLGADLGALDAFAASLGAVSAGAGVEA
ncbi:hypothetical protein [Deinococcus sp.]|uniref:hypothetical protein n=1 Tax=Deinococcus sp. TaxID=47478 RepID=UPI0025E1AD6A|nr:hypothetical protein [Deinococcus sp.]